MSNKSKKNILLVIFFILPFIMMVICLGIGRYYLNAFEVIKTFLVAFGFDFELNEMANQVIFNIRLPRILMAIFAGAGLSIAGAGFQSIFSNPLATPDTLGVAAGASFGAVIGILFGFTNIYIQMIAFVFGIIAVGVTFCISRQNGRITIIMMVLAGLVVSSLFEALVAFSKYIADPQDVLPVITFWLMGSLNGVSINSFLRGLPFILVGIILIFFNRWQLNIISLDEDEAISLGVNVNKIRLIIMVGASMITASIVSICGLIGWVGLLVPHISRMIFGNDNRYVIPSSMALGASFLLIMDTMARSLTKAEIPVSILVAIIGAPFFIGLLRKTGGVKQ